MSGIHYTYKRPISVQVIQNHTYKSNAGSRGIHTSVMDNGAALGQEANYDLQKVWPKSKVIYSMSLLID